MGDGVMLYFELMWSHAHLYRVGEGYILALVTASPEALKGGIKAPERVTPDANLLEKLRAVIKLDTSPSTTEGHGQGGSLKPTGPISA